MPVAFVSAVVLAACGSSATSAPVSVAPSAPATSQAPATRQAPSPSETPAATASAATASATPIPSGAGGSFDACALLTTAEVARILGAEAMQGKPVPGGGWIAGQCAWNGPSSGVLISVGTAASIAAFGDSATPDAKAKLAQFKKASGTPKDVAGIGEGAVSSPNGIAAYTGGTYLELTNLGLPDAQLIAIAKLAIAKL